MHLVNVLSHSREYPELVNEESTLSQCRELYICEDEWQEFRERMSKLTIGLLPMQLLESAANERGKRMDHLVNEMLKMGLLGAKRRSDETGQFLAMIQRFAEAVSQDQETTTACQHFVQDHNRGNCVRELFDSFLESAYQYSFRWSPHTVWTINSRQLPAVTGKI